MSSPKEHKSVFKSPEYAYMHSAEEVSCVILERIAMALEAQLECQKETLKQYNIQGCETLKAMDARESREIAMNQRAAEYHELQKKFHAKQMELIQQKIDDNKRIIAENEGGKNGGSNILQ